jgi:DNA-binding MarR family transcriptional regulator
MKGSVKKSSMVNKHSAPVLTWFRLARTVHRIGRTADEHLRGWGLTGPQVGMLLQIAAAEGQTQQELACDMDVTKGNISQMVTKLERDGLIRREQRGAANELFLTCEGRRLLDEVVPEHDALIEQHFVGLSQEEQSQLRALLRKLERSLE